mmetsp:Transcript_38224/g.75242  ORF Transcript_38224/g.75242 Transcript_38224/m.75242 type:complete len:453 (-) Transcript_38224:396-1754(-)
MENKTDTLNKWGDAEEEMKDSRPKTTWTLNPEDELRIEVDNDTGITIKLVHGDAECFGAELAMKREYAMSRCKLAIFSWHGAEVEIEGVCKEAYIEESDKNNSSPMISYINTHAALDRMRKQSRRLRDKGTAAADSVGPRTIIVGPQDSGKSTLTRLLCNYAVRMDWKPLLVDVDCGQNMITIPGAIAAATVDKPFEMDKSCMEGLTLQSLCYFYGHTAPSKAVPLFKTLLERLAEKVNQKLEAPDNDDSVAGLVVNTCGWVEDGGFELLNLLIELFKIDVVLVVGDAKLFSKLKPLESKQKIVAKLNRSTGVVKRDSAYRRRLRNASIREYFYGPGKSLCPHTQYFTFNELRIYRVGGGPQAPSSALPLGSKRLIDPNKLVLVDLAVEQISKCVLAVSFSSSEADLLTENVAGFIFVEAVDVAKQQITCLTPSPGPLPQPYCLTGSIKWID